VTPQQDEFRRRLERLVGVHFTEGNAVEVLRNGDEIFPPMLDAITRAERTVDFMTYVYWQGQPARDFAAALSERARAGVRVRVLIDAFGGWHIEKGLVDRMAAAGVRVEWFRKPLVKSPFKQNHRCHRKVLVVDERVGFTGGVGIAEEWCGDARDATEWRDTHFRLRGPVVDGLAAAFAQDWAETGAPIYDDRDEFPLQPQPGSAVIQVVRGTASMGYDDLKRAWFVLLRSAQRSIRLQTAYFAPERALLAEFRAAVERGVKIEVMVPGPHWDKRVSRVMGESSYAELTGMGVEVWSYQPTMLHTKIMLVDGRAAFVGSSNVNRRSLDHDEEVALVVLDDRILDVLDRHFEEDRERCRRIDPGRWEQRSPAQRVKEAAVQPIRRWF
jgi:cardiolipin synthase A/B